MFAGSGPSVGGGRDSSEVKERVSNSSTSPEKRLFAADRPAKKNTGSSSSGGPPTKLHFGSQNSKS